MTETSTKKVNLAYRNYIIEMISEWGILVLPLIPAMITIVEGIIGFPQLIDNVVVVWILSITIGVGIEIFGISTNETRMKVILYQQTKHKNEPEIDMSDIDRAYKWYIGLVFLITVFLGILPLIITAMELPQFISKICVALVLLPILYLVTLSVRVTLTNKAVSRIIEERATTKRAKTEHEKLLSKLAKLQEIIDQQATEQATIEQEVSNKIAIYEQEIQQLNQQLSNDKIATEQAKKQQADQSIIAQSSNLPAITEQAIEQLSNDDFVAHIVAMMPVTSGNQFSNIDIVKQRWSPSTARKYFKQAKDSNIIYKNGDGQFHKIEQ